MGYDRYRDWLDEAFDDYGAAEVPEELIQKAEHLDRFYIPTRYPNAWPSGAPHKHYTRDDADLALRYAKEVLDFVKGEIE